MNGKYVLNALYVFGIMIAAENIGYWKRYFYLVTFFSGWETP